MSGPGSDFASTPSVAVVAPDSEVGAAVAPRNNNALMLASALSELNPKLAQLGGQLVAENQAVQSAAAKKLAIQTGGKSLADAVRSGDLAPTQNPYFIQDYNREAAAVASQGDFDQLNTDAASWAEKNDPAAFRAKYTQAVSAIGEKYGSTMDSQEGFAAIASQNTQQAYAANTAYNAARIVSERQENLSALTAKAVIATNAQFGGKATGAQVEAAIEPLKQQWLSTGGDIAQWNKVATQGILAASFNTHSENILDTAKTISNGLGDGSGSLYDTLGAADQIETARYRLMADARDQMRLEIQAREEKTYEQGLNATGALFSIVGPRLFTGGVTPDEQSAIAAQMAAHYPAAAVAEAFGQAAKVTNSIRELNTNAQTGYETSSEGASHMAAVWQEANQRGWSPELQTDLGQMVLNGKISVTTQQQVIDAADRTTAKAATSADMGAIADQHTQAKNIQKWSSARDSITGKLTQAFNAASQAGHTLTPGQMQQYQDTAIGAASTWLELHPADFNGAQKAALDAVRAK